MTNTGTSGGATSDRPPLRGRYVYRLVSALAAAGVAVVAFGAIAYVEVIEPIADPAVRGSVLSAFVGLILTTFVSLALVAITIGSNTAINLRLLTSKARQMERGEMDVELETDREDEFGELADALASMRDTLDSRLGQLERQRRETEQLNDALLSKAEQYERTLSEVMQGDLSKRVDTDTDVEALRSIGESINKTVSELESATTNISRQMESLSANAEEVTASANELASTSERAAEIGSSGREAAGEAIDEMADVEADAEHAVDEMNQLRSDLEEIEETVRAITELARRTNILAVNARIESSRSESAGEGYSVVADEIRDLAEEAQQTAENIERRIERLRVQTEDTAAGITETQERATVAAETVREALGAFDELAEYVEDVDANAQAISDATEEQADSVQAVAAMVDGLAEIGEVEPAEVPEPNHGFETVTQD